VFGAHATAGEHTQRLREPARESEAGGERMGPGGGWGGNRERVERMVTKVIHHGLCNVVHGCVVDNYRGDA
jgi:hypothetical protein